MTLRSWRDDKVVKNTCWFHRILEFRFQYPHHSKCGQSQASLDSSRETLLCFIQSPQWKWSLADGTITSATCLSFCLPLHLLHLCICIPVPKFPLFIRPVITSDFSPPWCRHFKLASSAKILFPDTVSFWVRKELQSTLGSGKLSPYNTTHLLLAYPSKLCHFTSTDIKGIFLKTTHCVAPLSFI